MIGEVLLRNAAKSMQTVTLANWAYGVTAIKEDAQGRRSTVVTYLPVEDLKIEIRTGEKTKKVFYCMLQENLRFIESGDSVIVELPRLDEGDVLLLKSGMGSRCPL